jgi:hypothetical protein
MKEIVSFVAFAIALSITAQAQAGGIKDTKIEKATLIDAGQIHVPYQHEALTNDSVALIEKDGQVVAFAVQLVDGGLVIDTQGHSVGAGSVLRLSSVEDGRRVFSNAFTF